MNKDIQNLREIKNDLSSLIRKISNRRVPRNHRMHSEIKGQNGDGIINEEGEHALTRFGSLPVTSFRF